MDVVVSTSTLREWSPAFRRERPNRLFKAPPSVPSLLPAAPTSNARTIGSAT
jgi:hypothetical protein